MNKNKPARKPKRQNLSVVPVTSRENTGTTARHPNVRAALISELKRETSKYAKAKKRSERLAAAIQALGSLKKGD